MPTLWLVGMMGSGKSTVGPRVAYALGVDFVDLDQVVALEAGCDLVRIFADEGEAGFRERESRALASVAGSPVVVACGGGVVEDPSNVTTMRAHGRVAWLDAPVRVLAGRLGDGTGRPMLQGDPVTRLTSLQRRRKKKYDAAAHARFDASEAPDGLAKEIVTWWRSSS
ncbi:MAG: shikimate kinase II [Actinobacteria bacterium]|nr:shikimate kinase II [Actinomycetota bacterium]